MNLVALKRMLTALREAGLIAAMSRFKMLPDTPQAEHRATQSNTCALASNRVTTAACPMGATGWRSSVLLDITYLLSPWQRPC
jgi:hypothetical protein